MQRAPDGGTIYRTHRALERRRRGQEGLLELRLEVFRVPPRCEVLLPPLPAIEAAQARGGGGPTEGALPAHVDAHVLRPQPPRSGGVRGVPRARPQQGVPEGGATFL